VLVEADPQSGAIRLDDEGVRALVAAARDPERVPAEILLAVPPDRLDAVLQVIARPVARLSLVVEGAEVRQEHQAWVVRDLTVLRLAVRPGLHQLMTFPPAHLTAALVRAVRMRPRRPAQHPDPDSDFTWHLELEWAGGVRSLTAVDGATGLRIVEPDREPRPVSNTEAYRILSTLLPREAVAG
jgi:hypothetical protein